MSFIKSHKNSILVSVSIIVLGGMIFFLNWNAYQKLIELKNERLNKTAELADASQKLKTLEVQSKKAAQIQAQKTYVLAQLPADVEATLFASKLESLGATMAITPLSVSISNVAESSSTKKSGGLSTSNYSLTLTTTFPTLLNFLAEMEKLDRLNTIESIGLSPRDANLSVNIGGTIYRIRENAK